MKYLIILSLTLTLSCVPQGKPSAPAETAAAPADKPDTMDAPVVMADKAPVTILDSLEQQMELTNEQVAHYFQLDTSRHISFEAISANTLGDSLLVVVVGSTDHSNCSGAFIVTLNGFTFRKVSDKEVRMACDMDSGTSDYTDFSFTDKQNFVVTTETWDREVDTEEVVSTKREFWSIDFSGQFVKSRPDEVETPAG